jgi:hypothetical protein
VALARCGVALARARVALARPRLWQARGLLSRLPTLRRLSFAAQ